MHKTRAIRLSSEDNQKIEQFLKLNPFFDFSSLARLSLLSFIEKPHLLLKPLENQNLKSETKRMKNNEAN